MCWLHSSTSQKGDVQLSYCLTELVASRYLLEVLIPLPGAKTASTNKFLIAGPMPDPVFIWDRTVLIDCPIIPGPPQLRSSNINRKLSLSAWRSPHWSNQMCFIQGYNSKLYRVWRATLIISGRRMLSLVYWGIARCIMRVLSNHPCPWYIVRPVQ